jgi:hypothetical protein
MRGMYYVNVARRLRREGKTTRTAESSEYNPSKLDELPSSLANLSQLLISGKWNLFKRWLINLSS